MKGYFEISILGKDGHKVLWLPKRGKIRKGRLVSASVNTKDETILGCYREKNCSWCEAAKETELILNPHDKFSAIRTLKN